MSSEQDTQPVPNEAGKADPLSESARKAQIRELYIGMQHIVFGHSEGILSTLRGFSLPPGAILDVGCGNGTITQAVAAALSERPLIGLDSSPEQIAFAQANHAAPNLRYQVGDAETLPDQKFAAVLAILMVQYLVDLPAFLRSVYAHLQPGGWLLYSTPLLPAAEPGRNIVRAIWSALMWHTPTYLSLDEHQTLLGEAGFTAIETEIIPSPLDAHTPKREAMARDILSANGIPPERADSENWLRSGQFAAQRPEL